MIRPHVRIIDAWNVWYHVNGHTFGIWLRGDLRGWRSRHHRERVEGDCKRPPYSGDHDGVLRLSRRFVSTPVFLTPRARAVACAKLVASLSYQRIEPSRAAWTITTSTPARIAVPRRG